MRRIFSIVLSVVALFAGCSSDAVLDEPIDEVEMSDKVAEFMCNMVKNTVSAEEFAKYAVGYGWRNVAEYDVDNQTGKIAETDTWGRENSYSEIVGAGPTDIVIEKDSLSWYFAYDAKPIFAYTSIPYQYVEKKGVMHYFKMYDACMLSMRVVSIDSERMVMLTLAGKKASGGPLYSLITYRRMTSDEREEMVKKCEKIN